MQLLDICQMLLWQISPEQELSFLDYVDILSQVAFKVDSLCSCELDLLDYIDEL